MSDELLPMVAYTDESVSWQLVSIFPISRGEKVNGHS